MTPQEIIKEIQNLPPTQRKEVIDSVSINVKREKYISEEEAEMLLYKRGIIGKPSDLDEYDDDEDFEPIEIQGEPLSETIIRERR